jgi:hypothetical protein
MTNPAAGTGTTVIPPITTIIRAVEMMAANLFNNIIQMEDSELLFVRQLQNRVFQSEYIRNDLFENHANGKNIIYHYKNENLFGFIRYKEIDKTSIYISSLVINKKIFDAKNTVKFIHKIYHALCKIEQSLIYSDSYKINLNSLNIHFKFKFSPVSEDALKIYFKIEKLSLLKKLEQYLPAARYNKKVMGLGMNI